MFAKPRLESPFQLNKFFNTVIGSSSSSSSTSSFGPDRKFTLQQEAQLKQRQEKKLQEEYNIELISDSPFIIPLSYWCTPHEFKCCFCLLTSFGMSRPRPLKRENITHPELGKVEKWTHDIMEFHPFCLRSWQERNEKILVEGEIVLTTIFYWQVFNQTIQEQV